MLPRPKIANTTLGRHLLIELFDCKKSLLATTKEVENIMVAAAKAAKATIVNTSFHQFAPQGVSGVVVIQESHLAIHTWPEHGFAAVDLFTCGEVIQSLKAYQYLKQAFEAKNAALVDLKRGQIHPSNTATAVEELLRISKTGQSRLFYHSEKEHWLTDMKKDVALSIRLKQQALWQQQSPFQMVEIYDTAAYGKIMTLDQVISYSERDESAYHEMIVHVPVLVATEKIKNVLVIGGGDGGTIRELLKHKTIETIVMVEIDAVVIEVAQRFFPNLSEILQHPKLKLVIEDGRTYVAKMPASSFDLVIVDAANSTESSKGLFTTDFYKNVYRILSKNGILVTQSESPYGQVDVFKENFQSFRTLFGYKQVHCYLTCLPTYSGSLWSFSFCSKGDIHPFEHLNHEQIQAFLKTQDLQYYNVDIHRAAFALPNFVQKLLRYNLG